MKYSSIILGKNICQKICCYLAKKYKELESKRKGSRERYDKNIKIRPITAHSIEELIKWKNGYHDKIAASKMNIVNFFKEKDSIEIMNNLSKRWSDKKFERAFKPQKNAPIWKIFIRHSISPDKFPIFDINVYRAYRYLTSGIKMELKSEKRSDYYLIYNDSFLPFFKKMQMEANCTVKELDEALFTFGKFLNDYEDYINT